MNAAPDDWRRMGQELTMPPGTEFVQKAYQSPRPSWDHDHCSMCSEKFTNDSHIEAYATAPSFSRGAGYEWICLNCFADFSGEFGWKVIS